jgi:hypothetical protein
VHEGAVNSDFGAALGEPFQALARQCHLACSGQKTPTLSNLMRRARLMTSTAHSIVYLAAAAGKVK